VETVVRESKLFAFPSSVDFCESKLLKEESRLVLALWLVIVFSNIDGADLPYL
jgi:hypothetical protein